MKLSQACYRLLPVLFMILLASAGNSQGFLRADGKDIVNEKGNVILRGMGLGGWMLQEGYMLRVENIGSQQHRIRKKIEELIGPEKTSRFYDAWLANDVRKIDVDSMASWGFNSIRLPMHFNLFTLPVDQEPSINKDTWLESGFRMTDSLLSWCRRNKMYLILDLHAAPGGQGNDEAISDRDGTLASLWQSEANRNKTIALWRKLAERYAHEPWIGGYDILNEPNWGFENPADKNGCGEQLNAPLRKLLVDITAAIRQVDKNHLIIVEGNCWGNNYNGVLPLWDSNMVISFHKYWNDNDQASVQKFLDIRERYQVPVWLGESGENSNVWFRDAISLVEHNNIGWCWWPLKKLGFNNPLEVRVPAGYQKILDFWKGKGPRPSEDEAYRALMELTNNLKIENCIFHRDVTDAMFRQVRSGTAKPYTPRSAVDGEIIYAVDYDLGQSGVAYFDRDSADYHISSGSKRTAGNSGRVYRNDGVDVAMSGSAGSDENPYYVTRIEQGEWLQYSFTSVKKESYNLKIKVSSDSSQARFSIFIDGQPASRSLSVPKTQHATSWQSVNTVVRPLDPGEHTIRVYADVGDFNLKSMQWIRRGQK